MTGLQRCGQVRTEAKATHKAWAAKRVVGIRPARTVYEVWAQSALLIVLSSMLYFRVVGTRPGRTDFDVWLQAAVLVVFRSMLYYWDKQRQRRDAAPRKAWADLLEEEEVQSGSSQCELPPVAQGLPEELRLQLRRLTRHRQRQQRQAGGGRVARSKEGYRVSGGSGSEPYSCRPVA